MKVFFINNVYRIGSTGNIVYNIQRYLECKGIETFVAFGNFNAPPAVNVYKFGTCIETKLHSILAKFGNLQYRGSSIATARLIRAIKREKPDIVHIHCLNGYCVNLYALLEFLAKNKYKTMVTHHAEFYYTGSCSHAKECMKFTRPQGCSRCEDFTGATHSLIWDNTNLHWRAMHNAFSMFDKEDLLFTAVSPWVKNRAMLSPIVNNFPCIVVKNGIDTNVFHRNENWEYIKSKMPNLGRNFIVHVTATFEPDRKDSIKGSLYVVEIARKFPQYDIIVVASTISEQIPNLPANIHMWGRALSQNELSILYSTARMTLLTSQRETFSMVCAESLSCGTPVVGFYSGGPESIALPDYTFFSPFGDIAKICEEINKCLSISWDRNKICKDSSLEYANEIMSSTYLDAYYKLLK